MPRLPSFAAAARTSVAEFDRTCRLTLDHLARHPATARHIARKLVQYFVADQPPPALVERLGVVTNRDLVTETITTAGEKPMSLGYTDVLASANGSCGGCSNSTSAPRRSRSLRPAACCSPSS